MTTVDLKGKKVLSKSASNDTQNQKRKEAQSVKHKSNYRKRDNITISFGSSVQGEDSCM